METWNCSLQDAAHLAAVARDFCPFPDYSPSPLLNMMSDNSSLLLSEHYAAVQASLTPRQQQDFTQTLRSTFGREGKVSYGGVGIVALSLAVLFDTVARQVKGEYVSDQEPIPGLFLKDPRGTYSPPVYVISKYLRLVPHIANNPTRMRDETEKYILELKRAMNNIYAAQHFEDISGANLLRCYVMGKNMVLHIKRISNKNIDLEDVIPSNDNHTIDPFDMEKIVLNVNCDSKVASDRYLAILDCFGDHVKETFKNCRLNEGEDGRAVIEKIAWLHGFFTTSSMNNLIMYEDKVMLPQTDFDLKTNALGKWI